MEKKFELTEETIQCNGHTLYRIKALKDFSDVTKGDIGGFVEKEDNLFQGGKCWIYDNAKVYDNALVSDNARVFDDAIVHGNAKVYHDAWVYQEAQVFDNAEVYGDAQVYGHAEIIGNAQIHDKASIFDNAHICGNANVYDDAIVFGYAIIDDNSFIFGNAQVCGNAEIIGNAQISSIRDYIVCKNSWSSGQWFTWTRSNDKWRVGCFYGTGDELVKVAYKVNDENGRNYEMYVNFVKQLNDGKN